MVATLCFLLFVPSVPTDDLLREAFKQANFQSIPRDDSTGKDQERLKAWRNPKNDSQFEAKRELGEKFFLIHVYLRLRTLVAILVTNYLKQERMG